MQQNGMLTGAKSVVPHSVTGTSGTFCHALLSKLTQATYVFLEHSSFQTS